MKKINKTAQKVFEKLIGMMEDGYVKIDNSNNTFMPVYVEKVGENKNGMFISIAHYFTQNGDMVADPEMTFYVPNNDPTSTYPVEITQSFFGSKTSVIFENGDIKGFYKKEQADEASFAGTWFRNIKDQQGL